MGAAFPILLFLLAAPASAAEVDEKKAVLAVVQDFFDALKAKDEARVMSLVVSEGTLAGHDSRGNEDGFFVEKWPAWAKGLPGAKPALEERMHRPRVRIRGTMASVWTYYTFYRDAKFSHCGIDNFDMAKVEGRWRILNLTFTMETKGCRTR